MISINKAAKNKLSKRSKNPPWPGIIWLKSLIPNLLFTKEANKSPLKQNMAIPKPISNDEAIDKLSKSRIKYEVRTVINKPPKNPSSVLFGETFGMSFLRPKI